MRTALLVTCVLLGSACSLAVRRGDELAAQGKWYQATEAYDEALTNDPGSPEATQKRDDARTQALTELLRDAKTATDAKRFTTAAETLAKAFMLAERWQRPGTGAAEVELLHGAWVSDFSARLDAEGPLRHLQTRAELEHALAHPRFAEVLNSLNAAWSGAAAARCDAALARAGSGFLRALAAG